MFDEQGDKLKGLIDNMVDSLQLKLANAAIVCSGINVFKKETGSIFHILYISCPLGLPLLTLLPKTKESRVLFRRARGIPISDQDDEETIQRLGGTGQCTNSCIIRPATMRLQGTLDEQAREAAVRILHLQQAVCTNFAGDSQAREVQRVKGFPQERKTRKRGQREQTADPHCCGLGSSEGE